MAVIWQQLADAISLPIVGGSSNIQKNNIG